MYFIRFGFSPLQKFFYQESVLGAIQPHVNWFESRWITMFPYFAEYLKADNTWSNYTVCTIQVQQSFVCIGALHNQICWVCFKPICRVCIKPNNVESSWVMKKFIQSITTSNKRCKNLQPFVVFVLWWYHQENFLRKWYLFVQLFLDASWCSLFVSIRIHQTS